MAIAWDQFTPWTSLAGGLLIGAAASLYLLGAGRVAGVSGVLGSALHSLLGRVAGAPLAWAFLAGLVAAPWLWRLVAPAPIGAVDVGTPALLLAGLLVGFGVRLGQGCTSGHGVCGLSRGSPRSLVNVLAFMAAGALMVFVLRHVLGR